MSISGVKVVSTDVLRNTVDDGKNEKIKVKVKRFPHYFRERKKSLEASEETNWGNCICPSASIQKHLHQVQHLLHESHRLLLQPWHHQASKTVTFYIINSNFLKLKLFISNQFLQVIHFICHSLIRK